MFRPIDKITAESSSVLYILYKLLYPFIHYPNRLFCEGSCGLFYFILFYYILFYFHNEPFTKSPVMKRSIGRKLGSPRMTHLRLNWQGLIYHKGVKSRMRERSYTAEASSPLFHVQSRLQAALNQTISSCRHQKSLICVFIIYFHS